DVKALLRIAVVWNIPVACNRASADYMVSSPLMQAHYENVRPDYAERRAREMPAEARVTRKASSYQLSGITADT
ncbi:MAG TPA: hypothetical protein VKC57_11730, partial [Ktedonobacterales bacterium]|nr:hypothetical protein [Ktedonobacterales bacterium]